ncbi:hypothetical protein PG999_013084 [Apiospora kogelbergensis]|uniref:Uncharacterized protein n=1 Tax=Apiospora kogelbergensis TaxID=1337665 RepID=A0AAW0QAB1_9PEZI
MCSSGEEVIAAASAANAADGVVEPFTGKEVVVAMAAEAVVDVSFPSLVEDGTDHPMLKLHDAVIEAFSTAAPMLNET